MSLKSHQIVTSDQNNKLTRDIVLMDLDCFEAQIYLRDKYKFDERPWIVVNQSGIILAVNYAAKGYGIKRSHLKNRDNAIKFSRKNEIDLKIFEVQNHPLWDKPMIKEKRIASLKIITTIKKYLEEYHPKAIFEVSSEDEFYFDFTDEISEIMGKRGEHLPQSSRLPERIFLESDKRYLRKGVMKRVSEAFPKNPHLHKQEIRYFHGIIIANEIAKIISTQHGFDISAGIGPTKILAKLAVGINKPEGFTILPLKGLERASKSIDINDIPGLGKETGNRVKYYFGINTMYELREIPPSYIRQFLNRPQQQNLVDKILLNLSGQDNGEVVRAKLYTVDTPGYSKEIKTTPTRRDLQNPQNWEILMDNFKIQLLYLCQQIEERIWQERNWNKRLAKMLLVHVNGRFCYTINGHPGGMTVKFDIQKLARKIIIEPVNNNFKIDHILRDRALEKFESNNLELIRNNDFWVKRINVKIIEFENIE